MQKNGYLFLVIGVVLLGGLAASLDGYAASESVSVPVVYEPMESLRLLMDHPEKTGLQWELSQSPALQTEMDVLKKQAEEFIRFRKSRMSGTQKLKHLALCAKENNVYCKYLIQYKKWNEESKKPKAEEIRSVGDQLARADVLSLSQLSVRDRVILRALHLFPHWDSLTTVSKAILNSKFCVPIFLNVALGQKAEESLPEEKYRQAAIAHYSKAEECSEKKGKLASGSPEEDLLDRARFRMSLLKIGAGRCAEASHSLELLAADKEGEFTTRALYWRAQCAKEEKDFTRFEQLRNQLYRDYPMSFHALLLNRDRAATLANNWQTREPLVKLRSKHVPEANQVIRAAEVLQQMKAYDYSAELLSGEYPMLDKTEIGFRLYVALLLYRANDRIKQFRYLASAFREAPQIVSRTVLELFYPLKRFDVLKQYASKIDPYLVASLIRQESGFNENAKSPAGAIGLMQLMPQTAKRFESVSRRELYDAKTNIRLGAKFFGKLIERFDGDAELALAAYNAGPERVDTWIERYPTQQRVLFFDLIPFKETRDYVALISRNYFWYLSIYQPEALNRALASSHGGVKRAPASMSRPVLPTLFE